MENVLNLQKQKKHLRVLYKLKRKSYLESNKSELTDEFFISKYFPTLESLISKQSALLIRRNHSNDESKSLVVGGYWPLSDELNVIPILAKLHEMNFKTCLPVIEQMR